MGLTQRGQLLNNIKVQLLFRFRSQIRYRNLLGINCIIFCFMQIQANRDLLESSGRNVRPKRVDLF